MQFIVNKTSLLNAANMVSKCVAVSAALPILENLLFNLANSELTITGTDLQTTMSTVVAVESQDTGIIAIPAKVLLEVLRALPEQPIKVVTTGVAISITAGDGNFKFTGEDASSFPKTPMVETPSLIELPAGALAGAISKTIFAVSNDELRPAMTGVLFELAEHTIKFVSTDGAKLVRYIRKDIGAGVATSFIIPKKALVLLKSSLPAEDVTISVLYNKTSAFFHFGKVSVICRLIDEKYPAYEAVIPTDNPNQMVIDRLLFLNTLQRVAILANKQDHQVKLDINNNQITITAEDLDFANEAKDILSCEFTGEAIVMGFNAKQIIEALKNIDSEQISLQMSQPNKAALMYPVDAAGSEDLMILLMPLLINNK